MIFFFFGTSKEPIFMRQEPCLWEAGAADSKHTDEEGQSPHEQPKDESPHE